MFSGRLILLLGALAAAGLLSVRESQRQVKLGYQIANTEEQLRKTRQGTVTERARLQSLQAPARIISRVQELKLDLAPPSALSPYAVPQHRPGAPER